MEEIRWSDALLRQFNGVKSRVMGYFNAAPSTSEREAT